MIVGDKLWYVQNGNRTYSEKPPEGKEVQITKIGSKWITISISPTYEIRIDKISMTADGKGYSSPGKCYLSQEDYKNNLLIRKLFDQLKKDMPWNAHDNVSADDIIEAAGLLGIMLDIPIDYVRKTTHNS